MPKSHCRCRWKFRPLEGVLNGAPNWGQPDSICTQRRLERMRLARFWLEKQHFWRPAQRPSKLIRRCGGTGNTLTYLGHSARDPDIRQITLVSCPMTLCNISPASILVRQLPDQITLNVCASLTNIAPQLENGASAGVFHSPEPSKRCSDSLVCFYTNLQLNI